MKPLVFALYITVCNSDSCYTQNLQSFDTLGDCHVAEKAHRDIPEDGSWKSVDYICKLENGVML